jgi:hypothetical protein
MGNAIRFANRAQKRALRALYRTCAFPGCDVPFHRTEAHHILPWELGGPTDLINLLPLCARHHHLAHEGGWALQLAADRTLSVYRPDGELHATATIHIKPEGQTRGPEPEHPRQPGPEPLAPPPEPFDTETDTVTNAWTALAS